MEIENDTTIFLTLIVESRENEVVEFKKAENSFDFDDLGNQSNNIVYQQYKLTYDELLSIYS